MSVLYIVLPLALLLGGAALAAFLWAVRRGQFDDLETPAIRVVLEDDGIPGVRGPAAVRPRGEGSTGGPGGSKRDRLHD